MRVDINNVGRVTQSPRGRRVALLDWDGSLRAGFTVVDWMAFLAANGRIASGPAAEVAALIGGHRTGVDSHDTLAERTAELYAHSVARQLTDYIAAVAAEYVDSVDGHRLFPFAQHLLAELSEQAIAVIVVSGAPVEVLACYNIAYGFAEFFALCLEEDRGRYTGRVSLNPAVSRTKEIIVEAIRARGDTEVVLAIGNSESDLPLFRAARIRLVVDRPDLQVGGQAYHVSPACWTRADIRAVLAPGGAG